MFLKSENKMPRYRRGNRDVLYITTVLTPTLPLTLSLSIAYNIDLLATITDSWQRQSDVSLFAVNNVCT